MVKSTKIGYTKIKLYSLIEKMSDVELQKAWEYLQILHYDSSMLAAIENSKERQKPGDTFTKEEALQILYFAQQDK